MADTTYTRTVSTDDGLGFRYETKMTALTALRLYQTADEFFLANNLASGGKFDDIVYTSTTNGVTETSFVQLKHKQIATLDTKKISLSALRTKDDFNLTKYFHSYLDVKEKFKFGSKDVIFGKDFDSVKFFLFTNARLHNMLLFKKKLDNQRILLSTKSSEEKNFMLRKDDIQGVFLDTNKSYLDGSLDAFLNKFYFCTGQANEDCMDSLIHSEIEGISKELSKKDVQFVTLQLYDYIYKWLKTGEYLTKDGVNAILSRTSLDTLSDRKNECTLEFVPSFVKFVNDNCFDSNRFVSLLSKADNTMMCMTLLKQAGLTADPNKTISLQNLNKEDVRKHLMDEWLALSSISLIVDCEGDIVGVDKKKVGDFVDSLVQVNTSNRVIFVMTAGNETAMSIGKTKRNKKFNCTMANLSSNSQALIRAREVDFQGYKTSLASLMPKDKSLDTVFDMASMTQLLQGRVVRVGLKPVEKIEYYITRVLTRCSTVRSTLLLDSTIKAQWAVTGISLEKAICDFSSENVIAYSNELDIGHLNKPIFVIEENAEKEFCELSKKVKGNLHLIEFRRGKRGCHWITSKPGSDISVILQHVRESDEGELDYVPTDNIMEIKDKVVVITAEPGMGKSTLLIHLAAETKKKCPHVWVICLALNDYTEHFDRPDFVRNIEVNTKNLIAAAAGVDKETSKFDSRLFNQCYDVTGDMIVLLDGFDEITPYYTQQGIKLIETLKRSRVSRVWVTARPQWRDLLEGHTSTLSYTIKPFTTKDQKNFLLKYWKHQKPIIDDEKLKAFVDAVLNKIDECFDNKFDQFTGIPLQTRMIADVFLEPLQDYYDSNVISLKERINIVELYREFVNMKRGIQMKKAKITVSNASAKFEQRKLNEQRENELMRLALLAILPRKSCQKLDPPVTDALVKELKKMVNEGNEKSGIVLAFKGEQPQFIHRTFAEYFTALFFSQHFSSNKEFLRSDKFYEGSFAFVKCFFDRILAAGHMLHEAILNCDVESIAKLLENGADVNEKDRGGRTALHLAAFSPKSSYIINLLLKKGANGSMEDDVSCWRPIQYACVVAETENIAPLLEHSPGPLENGVVPINWQTLLIAAKGDYLQLYLYLLDNGIYEVEVLDDLSAQKWLDESVSTGLSILHLTAAYNAKRILEYLLRRNTRDSKARLIDCVDSQGNTPLLLAGARGCSDAIQVLVQAGANSLVKRDDGKNLLQFSIEAQNADIFEIALTDAKKRNALDASFLQGPVTTLINEKGVERSEWAFNAIFFLCQIYPNLSELKTSNDLPLLVAAVIKNNLFMVRYLCDSGADVNVKGNFGGPLFYAIYTGNAQMVELLLKYQPNKNERDRSGLTVLDVAIREGHSEIIQLLIEAGAQLGSQGPHYLYLHQAIENDRKDLVQVLLNCGVDVNIPDADGRTLLYKAILRNQSEIVEMLIDAGATFGSNVNAITDKGPFLHIAVENEQEEVLTALITSPDLNLEIQDDEGFTALYKATRSGQKEIFQLLINAGANIHCKSKNNDDLTHAVAVSRNEELFFYLLESEMNFNQSNNLGETGLSLLKAARAWNLVKYLDPTAVADVTPEVIQKETNNLPQSKSKKKKKNKSNSEEIVQPINEKNNETKVPETNRAPIAKKPKQKPSQKKASKIKPQNLQNFQPTAAKAFDFNSFIMSLQIQTDEQKIIIDEFTRYRADIAESKTNGELGKVPSKQQLNQPKGKGGPSTFQQPKIKVKNPMSSMEQMPSTSQKINSAPLPQKNFSGPTHLPGEHSQYAQIPAQFPHSQPKKQKPSKASNGQGDNVTPNQGGPQKTHQVQHPQKKQKPPKFYNGQGENVNPNKVGPQSTPPVQNQQQKKIKPPKASNDQGGKINFNQGGPQKSKPPKLTKPSGQQWSDDGHTFTKPSDPHWTDLDFFEGQK